MKVANTLLKGITQWIVSRKTTLLVWVGIAIIAFIFISINGSQDAATIAALSSPDVKVRDAEVLDLARSGRLAAELISTEDPTADAASPQNVLSAKIRADAGDSLITDIPSLTDSQAFDNLYAMQKDTVTAPDAVTGLSELGEASDRNLRTLAEGLKDGDPDVRTAAVAALIKIGGSKVVDLAAPLVTDDVAQDSALATLAGVGKPAIPVLTSILTDERRKEALRESAASALGQIGSPEASESLESAANAVPGVPELRRVCLTSLASIVLITVPQPGAAQPATADDIRMITAAEAEGPLLIASVLNENDDSFARSREALALGRLATPPAIGALVTTLGSYDLRLAGAAKAGVEAVGGAAVSQLAGAVRSPDRQVRVAAASALAVIGTKASLEADLPALSDSAPDVRRAAAEGLGQSGNAAAVPILAAHLGDIDGSVAAAVSYSMHELGQPAVADLIEALKSQKPEGSEAFFASQALAADGGMAIPALSRASMTAAVNQKVWIAVTLGGMHDPSAESTLTTLSNDSSPTVRWAASQGLEQYQGES